LNMSIATLNATALMYADIRSLSTGGEKSTFHGMTHIPCVVANTSHVDGLLHYDKPEKWTTFCHNGTYLLESAAAKTEYVTLIFYIKEHSTAFVELCSSLSVNAEIRNPKCEGRSIHLVFMTSAAFEFVTRFILRVLHTIYGARDDARVILVKLTAAERIQDLMISVKIDAAHAPMHATKEKKDGFTHLSFPVPRKHFGHSQISETFQTMTGALFNATRTALTEDLKAKFPALKPEYQRCGYGHLITSILKNDPRIVSILGAPCSVPSSAIEKANAGRAVDCFTSLDKDFHFGSL